MRKAIRVLLLAALIVGLSLAWRYPVAYLIGLGFFAVVFFAAVTYCLLRLPRGNGDVWTPGEDFRRTWDEIKGKEE